jgi:hypothetical protein
MRFAMPNIEDEIRSKTEAFAADLAVLVRRAALEAAASALGGAAPPGVPAKVAAKRGRGRPRKVAAAAPVVRAAARTGRSVPASRAAGKKLTRERAPGEKRPPAELAKLTEKLGDYIKAHPGLRMEAIGKALGAPTRELNLPIKKLLAAKKIRSEGHKRATEYFPS